MEAINAARLNVWRQQSPAFFTEAVLDSDGAYAPTFGECKQGIDINDKGEWGLPGAFRGPSGGLPGAIRGPSGGIRC